VPFQLFNGWVVAYGDILLGKPNQEEFPATGFMEAPPLRYWPSAEIPFSIHESVTEPERILRSIQYLAEISPLRFIPYNGQPDSIVFMPTDGICLSYLGRVGGNQPIYLDARCKDQEVLHEIMHALGFIHEQSRPDRDQYIVVEWDNIISDKQSQFDIVPDPLAEPASGRPFDFRSLMLYPPTMFARDTARPTMHALTGETIAPVSKGISPEDLERLRLIYGGR